MPTLSISIVTYAPDYPVVKATLETLQIALAHAKSEGKLSQATISLVDNGPGRDHAPRLRELAPALDCEVVTGHGNIGYGRGHNLALLASTADFHLVLNPDVELQPDAISKALQFMSERPDVVMLAPEARNPDGDLLYLCKRYPTVLDLALRGFAPGGIARMFRRRLAYYEMRDLPAGTASIGVPLLSGSFMFLRRGPMAAIGGFSEAFFLYFEDFDLSLRAAATGLLAYVPSVKIVHRGGGAARKGLRHVRLFVAGAAVFFSRHGWRLW